MILLFYFVLLNSISDTYLCKDEFLQKAYNPSTKENFITIPVVKNGIKKNLLTTNKNLFKYLNEAENFNNDTINYLNFINKVRRGNKKIDLTNKNQDSLFKFANLLSQNNHFVTEAKRDIKRFINKYSVASGNANKRFLKPNLKGDHFPYLYEAFFENNYFVMLGDGVILLSKHNCK